MKATARCDVRAEADVAGERSGRGAVRVDHPRQLPAGVAEQGSHHPGPLAQRFTACHVAEQEPQVRQPGPVDQIGVATGGDVVPEPARILLGVRVAADPHHQGRVVDSVALVPGEVEPLGQAARDDRGPQHVLGRLAQAEVDGDREPGQHLDPTRQ